MRILVATWFVLLPFFTVAATDPNQVQSAVKEKSKPKPKWANYDAWRKKLKEGLPEATVESMLGKPLYKRQSSDTAIWYYQYMPKIAINSDTKKKNDKISYPSVGIVLFVNSAIPIQYKQQREHLKQSRNPGYIPIYSSTPVYKLKEWIEPDWSAVETGKYDLLESPKKIKPIRKLQPWEKKETWDRLRFGMQDQTVRQVLGEPTKVIVKESDTRFIYNFPCEEVVLSFSSKELGGWSEPFWPEVEKVLYEPVDPNTK